MIAITAVACLAIALTMMALYIYPENESERPLWRTFIFGFGLLSAVALIKLYDIAWALH